MLLTYALHSRDLEIIMDVANVLMGPPQAARERSKLVARALVSLEAKEPRRPR